MHARLNGPDYANIIATNVVARTALLNHSCSQHYRPQQKGPFAFILGYMLSIFLHKQKPNRTFFFLFFVYTQSWSQILETAARLHNTAKHFVSCLELDESLEQVLLGCLRKKLSAGFRKID